MDIELRVLDDIFAGDGYYHPSEVSGKYLAKTRVHVVLLNWELLPGQHLLKLLRAATSISCADGGANRLLDKLWQFDLPTIADVFYQQGTDVKKPLFIIGDLDSYSPNIDRTTGMERPPNRSLQRFGFEVHQIIDEDCTDFDKVRQVLEKRGIIQDNDTMIVDGAFGGRFDQVAATMSALYKSSSTEEGRAEYKIILIGQESVCTLIPSGDCTIHPPERMATKVCGLLPFIPINSITTHGLKWDVNEAKMSMTGLVSSSNEILYEGVHVKSSDPVVWFSNLKSFQA